jgi:hypothetical protein
MKVTHPSGPGRPHGSSGSRCTTCRPRAPGLLHSGTGCCVRRECPGGGFKGCRSGQPPPARMGPRAVPVHNPAPPVHRDSRAPTGAGYLILPDRPSKCSHIGHSKLRARRSRRSGSMLVTLISQPHRGQGRRAIGSWDWATGWDSGTRFPQALALLSYAGRRRGSVQYCSLETGPPAYSKAATVISPKFRLKRTGSAGTIRRKDEAASCGGLGIIGQLGKCQLIKCQLSKGRTNNAHADRRPSGAPTGSARRVPRRQPFRSA